MNLQKYTTSFIISSFVSLITIGYIGKAFLSKKCPQSVPYEIFLIIPLLYGIFGVINYHFELKYSIVIGMLFGLLLSLVGRFKLNLPQLIFDFTKETEYQVHIIAIILYGGIFRFIITPLTGYIVD